MVMVPESISRRRLTYEDYLALPDDQDYEIIDGVLYVSPHPRPRHQVIAARLTSVLQAHGEETGGAIVVPDTDLIIDSENTYISPDIMVFAPDRFAAVDPDDAITILPDLAIEIISPTSDHYDAVIKRDLYARLGIPHDWLADPGRRQIVEHTRPVDGRYTRRVVRAPDLFRSARFPALAIDLARLFA